ncbi:unnamed protein product [Dibothriocephalus latus]|uniref:Uncharacterized protein n=1 Tax=Dibothriocephalus latus TaxID=60516 RepID=A0A3P7ND22_DIBLA|nr:unnamed protein product [Dibothriocephalus latus]
MGGGVTASRRIQSSHLDVLHSLSVPPYDTWERRLATRVAQWYQVPLKKRLEAGNKVRSGAYYQTAIKKQCRMDSGERVRAVFPYLSCLREVTCPLNRPYDRCAGS